MNVDTHLLRGFSGSTDTGGLPVSIEKPPAVVLFDFELQQDDISSSRDKPRKGDLQQWEHSSAEVAKRQE